MLHHRKSGCLTRFMTVLEETIPSHAADIAKAYQLRSVNDDEAAWPLILDFATDINYKATTQEYAAAWPATAYQYRFKEPNPWTGPWEGYATHVLDVAYLFMNYDHSLTPSRRQKAVELATDVIRFINGKPPFQQYDERSMFVKEYISEDGEANSKDKRRNRDAIWPELFSRIGFDTALSVWTQFFVG